MDVIKKLVKANEALAKALGEKLESGPLSEALLERHWVPVPLTADSVARLEAIAGFSFSPLLRALLSTKNAMPTQSVFGVGDWAGSSIIEKNEAFAAARAEYDWEAPKLVAITHDEDFFAVTEEDRVVYFCNNEGLIEREHGPLEGFLSRVTSVLKKRAKNPDEDDEDDEDPEAEYV
jgi:hypothetical protein